MYLAIIVLPLLGSIISGFFGRKIGVHGAQIITCSSVIVTTIMAILAFIEVGINNIPVSIKLFRWVDSESLNIVWGFHFDSLTVSMLIPVLIVSSLVHIYSIGYMSNDPHNQRFFSYLSLFTFMMIVLVTANNFLLMFVGWEGVGICSYLLVSFWFTRIAANQSSISAFLTNRVGDCFLTIGMFAILWSFGNIDYSTVFSLAPYLNENIITIIGICLLIGAMAKSSQVGLHVWLPMAMEGPTPVSALIHAATMVTAGVYLLMRTSPLIEYSSTILILSLWIGAITTVFSSLIGLFQQDIKKVIAYSTMSQLGMMIIAIGLSSYNIALFHLVNHAFYKGLLFLGAGAVIHAVTDNQDFRKYGGLKPFLPLTYSVMLIASLSLVAFPFMTGFYSKDFILESTYGKFYFSSIAIYYIATIGAMFTTLYSVKVLYLTFLTNPNGPITNYKQAHEGDIYMSLPLIILAILSIFFGYVTKDIFIGLGSDFFADNSLFIHPTHEITLDTEFAVPTIFKLLPLVFTILLSLLSIILSEFLPKILISFKFSRFGYNIFGFFNQRFLIELFYNKYISGVILKLGGQTTKVIDKGSIELLGPYGLEKGLLGLSKNIAGLDTGIITSYALYILIGLIFFIITPYLSLTNNSLFLLILFGLFTINNDFTIISNPPKPHTFVNISIKSSFDFKILYVIIYKLFNIKNIIAILFTSLIIFITRLLLIYFDFPADLSFILINAFKGIKIITNSIIGDISNTFIIFANNSENSFCKSNKNIILKDIHINFMDKNTVEQFQQVPIVGQANPNNRWNQWRPGMRPIPGSVTPDVEDMSFTLAERLEWIKFFQKKRLELYESEPIMKEINLDLLDKRSDIAQHKIKELIDARQGLEQWHKFGDIFWQVYPSYSVRTNQQNCLRQLIEINKGLGRPTTLDSLTMTIKNREDYLRVNKAWSMTFDGLHKDQLNKPYFPENNNESDKVISTGSGSPMQ
jgi:NADH-ubiquinone oxidoreductase chain 5